MSKAIEQNILGPSQEILHEAALKWKVASEFKFVRKVENWIYYAEKEKLFFRITEPSHKSKEDIISELAWLSHLQSCGILFAHPVKSGEGNYVETLESSQQKYFVSVFNEAEGKPLSSPEDYSLRVFQSWGRVLGQMHNATKSYIVPENVVPRKAWNTERNYLEIVNSMREDHGSVYRQFQEIDGKLKELSMGEDEYGLIHSDLHRGNFYINSNNQIVAFDFDDCLYHWFAYDIGVVFYYLDEKQIGFSKGKAVENFWIGYNKENILSEKSKPLVVEFEMYRSISMYYWCRKNLNSPTLSSEAKKWMKKKIKSCEESFM